MQSWSDPELNDRAQYMDALIRRYFDACNEGDLDKMQECFVPEAVHYFPPGMYNGPFVGALALSAKFKEMVETVGSYWTVDNLIVEPASWRAVMEWTHFKTKQKTVLRGIEVYEFDREARRIKEIRAYYASPQTPDLARQELQGFDYRARGYPMAPPPGARDAG